MWVETKLVQHSAGIISALKSGTSAIAIATMFVGFSYAAEPSECSNLLARGHALKSQEGYHLDQARKWFDQALMLDKYTDDQLEAFSERYEREDEAAFNVLEKIGVVEDEYVAQGCDLLIWFDSLNAVSLGK